jgi:Fur family ferric uptake transcriptional regulator
MTQQRAAIRAALDAAARGAVPRRGVATVYRTIRTLLDAGEAVAVELPGEPARYETAGRTHHHHFRCRACDRVYDVPGSPPRPAPRARAPAASAPARERGGRPPRPRRATSR